MILYKHIMFAWRVAWWCGLVCFKAVFFLLGLRLKSAGNWVLTVRTVPATQGAISWATHSYLLQIKPARQEYCYIPVLQGRLTVPLEAARLFDIRKYCEGSFTERENFKRIHCCLLIWIQFTPPPPSYHSIFFLTLSTLQLTGTLYSVYC